MIRNYWEISESYPKENKNPWNLSPVSILEQNWLGGWGGVVDKQS